LGAAHDIAARKYHAPLSQATVAFTAAAIWAAARPVPSSF